MSRSTDLLRELESYEAKGEREEITLKRIRALLDTHGESAFDCEHDVHHITGSAIVISPHGLLLHFHKKIHRWLQPGGHLDDGETPCEAAMRETLEETGLSLECEREIFHVDVHDTPSGHVHYDIRYLAYTDHLFFNPPASESQKVAWFARSSWATIIEPGLAGVMAKLARQ